ncbi:hypothetical protein EV175_004296 [Coemansia sp. RSA 1933]|nr:hypothetical protein EV175_004296 [Coemansia sp. RSA 1933]
MAEVRRLLVNKNYTKLEGSIVRLSMTPKDLTQYKQLVIRGITIKSDTEEKLHKHCTRYGIVCGIEIKGAVAKVWMETEEAARSALNNLDNSELFFGIPLERVTDSANDGSANTSIEVVVLDKHSHNGDNDSDHAHTVTDNSNGDSDNSIASVDMLRPADPLTAFGMSMGKTMLLGGSLGPGTSNRTESGEAHMKASLQRRKENVARKSTGGRHTALKTGSIAGKKQTNKLQNRSQTGGNYSSAESVASAGDLRKQEARYSGSEYGSPDIDSVIVDFMKMDSWRAKTPFIYNFLYRRLPDASTIEKGRHCLSMAWRPGSDRKMVDLYISQGNKAAVRTVRTWGKDCTSSAKSTSEIAMTSFQFPARGGLANVCSLLNAFNSKEVGTMHKHSQRDGNEFAVSTLKLYDQGRILFGCGTSSIIVWDTDGIKHKESLMILSDVDGVYDVGRDYVVANSTKGEMCVWKAGSRNYMWRYNDTRRFKASPGADANTAHIITALQIDPNDKGAFVGDMSGRISHGDFRSPHIYRLSPGVCAGFPRSFANAGDYELLVGTDDGYMALLDTRYIHNASTKISVVKRYDVPKSSQINRIRVCPHDSNVFACSIGHDVYIYRKEMRHGAEKALFCHQAHQTHVVDFDWHPSPQYKYAIGSAESGEGLDSGEIQIWEPSSIIL